MRIGSEARDHVGIFEQEVAGLGEEMPEQPGLAGPARPGQHERGKSADRPADLRFEFSVDVFHQ